MNEELDLDAIEKAESNANFLKWPGPHVLRFDRGPEIRRRHWIGQTPEDCEGEGCSICASIRDPKDQRKMKTTFMYEVSVEGLEEGALLDLSQTAQKALTPQMRACKAQHGDAWRAEFAGLWFRAERTGSGAGTRYTFTPQAAAKVQAQDSTPF